MTFKSTAIYDNRIEDKNLLESKLSLSELGDEIKEFYTLNDKLFATGYNRVVYGDHGPYLEFDQKHIKLKLFSRFNNPIDVNNLPDENHKYYYFWMYPYGSIDTKVYLQIKSVTNLPNAPKRDDGKKSNFNRVEGYADYKRGLYYVDPYQLKLEKTNK